MKTITADMVLMDDEQQPKHSARYRLEHGDHGVDTLYIRRSALPQGEPPRRIHITVEVK